jgi:hypothetical protein
VCSVDKELQRKNLKTEKVVKALKGTKDHLRCTKEEFFFLKKPKVS